MSEIIELESKEFFEEWGEGKLWYLPFIRGYRKGDKIYLRKNAVYIFPYSKEKLIAHEEGHINGKSHTWFGIMAWHGLFRM